MGKYRVRRIFCGRDIFVFEGHQIHRIQDVIIFGDHAQTATDQQSDFTICKLTLNFEAQAMPGKASAAVQFSGELVGEKSVEQNAFG